MRVITLYTKHRINTITVNRLNRHKMKLDKKLEECYVENYSNLKWNNKRSQYSYICEISSKWKSSKLYKKDLKIIKIQSLLI